MKFQHPSSSRFGDIPEKPEGWMKTAPLPLIGLTHVVGLCHNDINRRRAFSLPHAEEKNVHNL